MGNITIAGVDPALANFGLAKGTLDLDTGILDLTHLELIRTSKTKDKQLRRNVDDLERCRKLYNGLSAFLEEVDIMCVEAPVGSQNSRAAASYGACIGILSAVQTPMIIVTPDQVKIAAISNKKATKKEMIEWGRKTYPNADWLNTLNDEHLADAVAAIHAGVQTDQFNQAKAFMRK